ncbi:hypothetical protein HELRODRAFT_88518, partial [Helobdella robusta]|uniref:Amino acid transporter transmembrane domain-containing protein n=1 Tax=Helobdella robusta TaxID=6412 RepID=T1G735_HELRO
FSIWNTMMGTSILSIPWGIDKSGFVFGIILLVVMAGLTLYTAYLIVKSQKNIGLSNAKDLDFSEICRHYLGSFGAGASYLLSLLSLSCATIVYWILMSNFLFNSVDFVYGCPKLQRFYEQNLVWLQNDNNNNNDDDDVIINNNSNDTNPNKDMIYHRIWNIELTVPLFLLLIIFPLLNFKSPTFFTKFNAFGTISIIYLVTFITIKACRWGLNLDFNSSSSSSSSSFHDDFKWTFPVLSGMLSLAYFIHNAILSILKNQKNPENNTRDLSIAYMCVMFTFVFIGVTFYASFPLDKSCIADNLLNNFIASDILTFLSRIFLLIQMTTVFPLLAYIFRSQLMVILFKKVYPGLFHVLMFNSCLVSVCILFAIFYPHIGSIIRYCGAICGLGYIFSLPIIIYLIQSRASGKRNIVIITLVHVIVVVIGVANCVAQFFM